VRQQETGQKEHAQLLAKRTEATQLADQAKRAAVAYESQERDLEGQRSDRRKLFVEFLGTATDEKRHYDEIIIVFGKEKARILGDLEFQTRLHLDLSGLFETLEGLVDGRQVAVRSTPTVPSALKSLEDKYKQLAAEDTTAVEAVVHETVSLAGLLAGFLKRSKALARAEIYDALFGRYLHVVPTVTYSGVGLRRLSLGQKATVLIKLYLAQGDHPIVIDSHDDYLDNAFIMSELVDAVRDARLRRQVILVSNNGNVVMNSDVDQLVIATARDGELSYSSGSLENPRIRDLALRVLEGGEEAFRSRQQKYRMV